MSFHVIIVSLIATALLMCSLSLVGDAIVYFKHQRRLHGFKRQVAAAEYPHPIPNQYPVERPTAAPVAIHRSASARRQLRLSGGSMSEMREVLGGDARRRAGAAR